MPVTFPILKGNTMMYFGIVLPYTLLGGGSFIFSEKQQRTYIMFLWQWKTKLYHFSHFFRVKLSRKVAINRAAFNRMSLPAGIWLFKVHHGNIRIMCEILQFSAECHSQPAFTCSKSTRKHQSNLLSLAAFVQNQQRKTPEQCVKSG